MSEVRISPMVMKEAKVVSSEEGLSLYEGAVSLMRRILVKNTNYQLIDTKPIIRQAEIIVNQLSLCNEELLMLFFNKDCKDGNYLPYHSVNVCILCIEVGLGLGFTKRQLIELGVCALVHDIGMAEYPHLSKQPRRLNSQEYRGVQNHPTQGLEILKKIEGLNEKILYAVYQHHERLDGSGYPEGLKGESISEYARIIGLADAYEAMVHHRTYRYKLLPLEAIREIIGRRAAFEHGLIKALIERVGVFPIGSLVELNTKELAVVIKLNYAAPLRPVAMVRILRGDDHCEPAETKVLDLTNHSNIYIKKAIMREKTKKDEDV